LAIGIPQHFLCRHVITCDTWLQRVVGGGPRIVTHLEAAEDTSIDPAGTGFSRETLI
jgi:hypothetical protein